MDVTHLPTADDYDIFDRYTYKTIRSRTDFKYVSTRIEAHECPISPENIS